MADRIRYYMDAHVPTATTVGLRRRGIDVLTCQEAGLRTATDQVHLEKARSERRVIFTQDVDFLRLHADGMPHCGITYAPQGASIGRVIRGLVLIHDVLDPEDMVGHVEYI